MEYFSGVQIVRNKKGEEVCEHLTENGSYRTAQYCQECNPESWQEDLERKAEVSATATQRLVTCVQGFGDFNGLCGCPRKWLSKRGEMIPCEGPCAKKGRKGLKGCRYAFSRPA